MTASAGAPRVAGLERPTGMNVGAPGDAAGQLAAVRGALDALQRIGAPGEVIDLPIECVNPPRPRDLRPPEPVPITRYLVRHPWALPRFLRRDPPPP